MLIAFKELSSWLLIMGGTAQGTPYNAEELKKEQ
jgi:hypothetical protein